MGIDRIFATQRGPGVVIVGEEQVSREPHDSAVKRDFLYAIKQTLQNFYESVDPRLICVPPFTHPLTDLKIPVYDTNNATVQPRLDGGADVVGKPIAEIRVKYLGSKVREASLFEAAGADFPVNMTRFVKPRYSAFFNSRRPDSFLDQRFADYQKERKQAANREAKWKLRKGHLDSLGMEQREMFMRYMGL